MTASSRNSFAAAIAIMSLASVGYADAAMLGGPTRGLPAQAASHQAIPVQMDVMRSQGGMKGGGHGDIGGGHRGGGHRGGGGPGWGPAAVGLGIGIIGGIIANSPPAQGRFIDNPNVDDEDAPVRRKRVQAPQRNQRQSAGRGGSGVPPAGERRLVPDEVIVELPNSASQQTITAVRRRFRLDQVETQLVQLTGTTFHRWRIPDRRSVPAVIRALEANNAVASAQPNYLYTLQQSEPATPAPTAAKAVPGDIKAVAPASPARGGDPAQYALAKMRLPEAHALASGDNILVAVIDSGVDLDHPELKDAVAGTFNPYKQPMKPHAHGTAIAALIAGRSRLMGSAPSARVLAARAFDPAGASAEATTFNILKSLDWSAANNARIINMSFAGPADPVMSRSIEAARKKGAVMIAAAGNEGPKSAPLYPAAYPTVIAVTATDADDKLYKGANRGRHIAVAAPGVDILVAVPDGGYQISTGTSYSAAEVSGVVALMLQRKPDLTPDAVQDILRATAKDLGPKGRDDDFGAGMTDAYRAVTEDTPPQVSTAGPRN